MKLTSVILLLCSSVAWANPKAVHFSAVGDYLVDENGNKTTITGHPYIVCHYRHSEVKGTFQKARGAVVYVIGYDTQQEDKTKKHYFQIVNPICDLNRVQE